MTQKTRRQELDRMLFAEGVKGNPDIELTYGILWEICDIERLELKKEGAEQEKRRMALLAGHERETV